MYRQLPLPSVTIALTVRLPDEFHEMLIAELADLGFDAFERMDGALIAHGMPSIWTDTAREALARWLRARSLPEEFEEEAIVQENWNERWEESITPIVVGRFLIAPTWAEVPARNAKTLLRIDPKMSFGTGYHASTRLVLRWLPGLVRDGMRVLDAGTGTGILAIAALKLGAAEAIGFDIDPWAVTNATENASLNGVTEQMEIREGGLEVVPEIGFGLVVANINLNVLEALLPDLTGKLGDNGRLVLAGLLKTDRDPIVEAFASARLTLHDESTEDEWWSCVVRGTGEG